MCTYLQQTFKGATPDSIDDVRKNVIEAGTRRIRPCLMTTFTTILALTPVLLSTGRGADVMKPMAIPSVGGMIIELVSLFGIPVSYCGLLQIRWKLGLRHPFFAVDPKDENAAPSPMSQSGDDEAHPEISENEVRP